MCSVTLKTLSHTKRVDKAKVSRAVYYVEFAVNWKIGVVVGGLLRLWFWGGWAETRHRSRMRIGKRADM